MRLKTKSSEKLLHHATLQCRSPTEMQGNETLWKSARLQQLFEWHGKTRVCVRNLPWKVNSVWHCHNNTLCYETLGAPTQTCPLFLGIRFPAAEYLGLWRGSASCFSLTASQTGSYSLYPLHMQL